jgi:hypothetical protein
MSTHKVATNYVLIAEENRRRYDEFLKKLRDQLPPGTSPSMAPG